MKPKPSDERLTITLPSPTLIEPNYYEVNGWDPRGSDIRIIYGPEGLPNPPLAPQAGGAQFIYQHGLTRLKFAGNQIRVVPTDLGRVVSVTILQGIDCCTTTYSLVLPTVQLCNGQPEPVDTFGVQTGHRFWWGTQECGQDEVYVVTLLRGTARRIGLRQPPR
jgi:hypothetical protein